MRDKYNLFAYFFDGQVKIGSENDLEAFLPGKKSTHGLYEISCSAVPMADPKYLSKSGGSFALTAAAHKFFIYEGMKLCRERTKLSQIWEKSRKHV
jgi:hypothetical protein